ncbi:TRAP transporter small permease [Amorphus orientalis]|uniref:TRAP transporter small permease protein n=1 Tax=Amorphus orientalis TaxID=649198 RepID=A0AAE3VMD3_9HYPH|nr:TRAP transporter small permease [Amorphus orientalis]MDQ0314701.1 TRAP-type C4-dicarboxylate transport system permease small subunit [Amorphus orientalis]
MLDRPPSERIVVFVERVAAIMLGLVTLLVAASAFGRYAFTAPVPDAFDISRLALAVAVAWGFASLGFRGSHIKVDLLAQALSPSVVRILDLIAWTVLLVFTIGLVWKLGGRVVSQFPGGEKTMDLRLPHWPFLSLLVAGFVMAIAMTLIRMWRMLVRGESLEPHETLTDDENHGAAHE